jgi:hypothetical protein
LADLIGIQYGFSYLVTDLIQLNETNKRFVKLRNPENKPDEIKKYFEVKKSSFNLENFTV